jgi:alpha-beta hydrolase superfamily lysophospholipase
MRSREFRVDVSRGARLPAGHSTVATVYLPERLAVPATAVVAFPGAGLTRHYFDIALRGGYSQARHHVSDGFIFISCDHLGAGDSSHPAPDLLDFARLAAASNTAVTTLIDGLRMGTLADGLPAVDIDKVVGIGHAMGAGVLTVLQARHQTFDAVALLGWSAIANTMPLPNAADEQAEATLCADDPEQARDGGPRAPWRSSTVPGCAAAVFDPGVVADDAAAIGVPILLACGRHEAVPDPLAEPAAYRRSRLVTVSVVEDLAHVHNLSANRAVLWDQISDFACVVRPRVSALR